MEEVGNKKPFSKGNNRLPEISEGSVREDVLKSLKIIFLRLKVQKFNYFSCFCKEVFQKTQFTKSIGTKNGEERICHFLKFYLSEGRMRFLGEKERVKRKS